MNGQQRHAHVGRRVQVVDQRIRNVVKLQVQEDREAEPANVSHQGGPVGDERRVELEIPCADALSSRQEGSRPRLLAVTALTSLHDDDLAAVGVADGRAAQVSRLARLALQVPQVLEAPHFQRRQPRR